MDLGLRGKRALVMAASKVIGRAAAEALVREHAHVIISSSDDGRCKQAAKEIAAKCSGMCDGLAADMFVPDAMDSLAERVSQSFGPIDILVINHVGPSLGLAQSVDWDVLDSHYRLMLVSPLRLIAAILPGMRERRWGRILSTGGVSMVQTLPNKIMDNIFRPALMNYTKTLSNEIAADGITVNMIMPGTFETDRVHESTASNAKLWNMSVEDVMRQRLQGIPAGRFGDLGEWGATVAFVCSVPAGYINGSIIRIDGGQTKPIL
jgi:3-oxoacyl-[acyl-carrier protein] reductase